MTDTGSNPYARYPVERRLAIINGEILRLQDQRYRHDLTVSLCDALTDTLQSPTDLDERELALLSIQRLDVALRRLQEELEVWSGESDRAADLGLAAVEKP